jgi:hypothetical protein
MAGYHRGYSEKRDFVRVSVECTVSVREAGSNQVETGTCTSLSGKGLMFLCDRQYPIGTMLEVSVVPQTAVVPPLDALVEVVRAEYNEEERKFAIAGVLKR